MSGSISSVTTSSTGTNFPSSLLIPSTGWRMVNISGTIDTGNSSIEIYYITLHP